MTGSLLLPKGSFRKPPLESARPICHAAKPLFVIGAKGEGVIAGLGSVVPSMVELFRRYINLGK